MSLVLASGLGTTEPNSCRRMIARSGRNCGKPDGHGRTCRPRTVRRICVVGRPRRRRARILVTTKNLVGGRLGQVSQKLPETPRRHPSSNRGDFSAAQAYPCGTLSAGSGPMRLNGDVWSRLPPSDVCGRSDLAPHRDAPSAALGVLRRGRTAGRLRIRIDDLR